jgi:DNA-binding transcriptional LysR family regulator
MRWKKGSFAAASAKLYKTPSALSYTIHKLESDLNIQLLDRSGHRARFTPTGQMLLEKGREVLHTVRELEKQAIKLHQGWENALVLAVDSTFLLLAPLVSRFYQQHTAARLRFVRDTRPAAGVRWWKGGLISLGVSATRRRSSAMVLARWASWRTSLLSRRSIRWQKWMRR